MYYNISLTVGRVEVIISLFIAGILTLLDCCNIDLSHFLTSNLDRLTGNKPDFGNKNHQKLEILEICRSVWISRNSLNLQVFVARIQFVC